MAVIYFNDRPIEIPAGTTLKELLKLQGRDPELVIVTVDEKFVPRAEYRKLLLPEGARVRARELQSGG